MEFEPGALVVSTNVFIHHATGNSFFYYAFRGILSERVILYFIGYDLTLLYLLDGKYNCNNSHSRDFNSIDRITSFF